MSKNTNVVIAGITTGWSRIWLYRAMLNVGLDNMIYCDTDSIIYKHKTGNNPIKTNTNFGGMTDELDGEHITEIVALAPKTYAYKISDGKVEVKAKGFSLNQFTSEKINFDNMRGLVLNNDKEAMQIEYDGRIRQNAKDRLIYSNDETKKFRYDYTKRTVDYENRTDNFINTLPIK